jgi:hypothetical protein
MHGRPNRRSLDAHVLCGTGLERRTETTAPPPDRIASTLLICSVRFAGRSRDATTTSTRTGSLLR